VLQNFATKITCLPEIDLISTFNFYLLASWKKSWKKRKVERKIFVENVERNCAQKSVVRKFMLDKKGDKQKSNSWI